MRVPLPQPTKPPLAPAEIGERCGEVVATEVRPQRVDETQLGVGRLPQQKVREPLLAAGADQEIDVAAARLAGRTKQSRERVA